MAPCGRKMSAAVREKVEGTATRIVGVKILTSFSDSEFLEYARRSEDSNEFDALGGAEKSLEAGDPRAEGDSRLPE
jgi:hypothetical protein